MTETEKPPSKTKPKTKPQWQHKKVQARFLQRFARTGNAAGSARSVGLPISGAYKLRKTNPKFATAWADAAAVAYSLLEEEARRRAIDGVPEPVIRYGKLVKDEHGKSVVIRHYSDGLMVVLLKARREDGADPAEREAKEELDHHDTAILTDDERHRRVTEILGGG